MTQFLPPNLLTLFAARDPIPYLPPLTKLTHEKSTSGYSGIRDYVKLFEDPKDTPPPTKYETKDEKLERRRREKQEQVAYKLEQEIAHWNPNDYERCTGDPFRTLYVGRINYDTSESKLKREFESYGPIRKIYIVNNKKAGKPRGYAFVEYEHERDMHSAYKHADGKKIDGRRVLVDVERGRTVKGWLPRRLGGGLGGTRRGGPDVNVKISGREDNDFERRIRDRSRERSREKDRIRRDRDRPRDKDKVERRGRDRSRDREKHDRRDREKSKEKDREKKDRDRDRDRDRSERKRKHKSRSRSRDKKRDKKDKEKDKERNRDKVKTEDEKKFYVKEEPTDDYSNYNDSYAGYDEDGFNDSHIKQEQDDENGHESA